ncbi:MAG: hypothetical protein ACTSRC_04970 [Candidatus Helarchaeota archaeon]
MPLTIYLVSQGGLNLYTYKSGTNGDEEEAEDYLYSSIVHGVVKALKCITNPDLNVNLIDLGEVQLIFKYGVTIWGFLISDSTQSNLHKKLELLISKFETKYSVYLKSWNGHRDIFAGTKEIIEEIFCNSQKNSIEKFKNELIKC